MSKDSKFQIQTSNSSRRQMANFRCLRTVVLVSDDAGEVESYAAARALAAAWFHLSEDCNREIR